MTELEGIIITGLIHAHCEIDVNEYQLFGSFVYHRKNDSALSAEDEKVVVKGRETIRKSTACRIIHCKGKDTSRIWEKVSNLNDFHPIQVAKYALA